MFFFLRFQQLLPNQIELIDRARPSSIDRQLRLCSYLQKNEIELRTVVHTIIANSNAQKKWKH